ncbi:MAG: F0F1 ATP synthase subunit epsilon [Anaerolineae bacterium]|nr:F0F1 ATP synthase subunit epsilon [Anaerolineae bacterium]
MKKSFYLTVLTPEQVLLEAEEVTQVQAQLADGGPIGIYPGHAPLLAETVAAPLRYADASGEHVLDLGAGILQVNGEGVTVFAGRAKPCEGSEPSQGSEEDDRHFDRLAQELLAKLSAQPDGLLETEQQAEENRT